MQPEATTLAYLAGMIDGDGYITINQSRHGSSFYFGPQVGIAGTRREPHDLAASIWGGKVGVYHSKSGHRPQFQWSRQGSPAVPIIEALRPYLLVKREQADLALDLWRLTEDARQTRDDPFPWFGPDFDPTEACRDLRREMIDLNQSRNRVGKKAAGRLLDGREWNEFPTTSHRERVG